MHEAFSFYSYSLRSLHNGYTYRDRRRIQNCGHKMKTISPHTHSLSLSCLLREFSPRRSSGRTSYTLFTILFTMHTNAAVSVHYRVQFHNYNIFRVCSPLPYLCGVCVYRLLLQQHTGEAPFPFRRMYLRGVRCTNAVSIPRDRARAQINRFTVLFLAFGVVAGLPLITTLTNLQPNVTAWNTIFSIISIYPLIGSRFISKSVSLGWGSIFVSLVVIRHVGSKLYISYDLYYLGSDFSFFRFSSLVCRKFSYTADCRNK